MNKMSFIRGYMQKISAHPKYYKNWQDVQTAYRLEMGREPTSADELGQWLGQAVVGGQIVRYNANSRSFESAPVVMSPEQAKNIQASTPQSPATPDPAPTFSDPLTEAPATAGARSRSGRAGRAEPPADDLRSAAGHDQAGQRSDFRFGQDQHQARRERRA